METTFTHKCPNCGGPLLFNPKDQKFHCEYCLNIYTEEEVTRYEQQKQLPMQAQWKFLIVQAVALKLSPMQQRQPHTVIIAIIQLSWLVD